METRKQLKARLQAAGYWEQYVAKRDQLVAKDHTPFQARTLALSEIEAMIAAGEKAIPQAVEPDTPISSRDESTANGLDLQFGQQVRNHEAVQWVGHNISNQKALPDDAPGGAAWGLLMWVRRSPANESTFWSSIWPKTLPTAAALKQKAKTNSNDDDDVPCPACGQLPEQFDPGTEKLRALIPKVLAEVTMRANSIP